MTKEELMKPRYKVIADWPGSLFRIGDIFQSIEGPAEVWESQRSGSKFLYNPSNYPALFKRLEWWEERKPEDMPEYVKYDDVSLFVPKQRVCKGSQAPFNAFNFTAVNFLPATESEYQSFIQR